MLLICAWLALMPPFFTHGACTAEFGAAGEAVQRARPALATLGQAQAYLTSQSMPYQVLSAERCERAPPREVEVCSGGPTLLVSLVRMQTDMNPYRMLKLPALGVEVYWGR
jgi:hypothetical protein